MSRHLELEVECPKAAKPNSSAHMVESSSRKTFRSKGKYPEKAKQGTEDGSTPKKMRITKCKRGKRIGMKDKSKLVCYNCRKEFTREYTEPKKVHSNFMSSAYVTSHAMVAYFLPMGTVDSEATEHIARD